MWWWGCPQHCVPCLSAGPVSGLEESLQFLFRVADCQPSRKFPSPVILANLQTLYSTFNIKWKSIQILHNIHQPLHIKLLHSQFWCNLQVQYCTYLYIWCLTLLLCDIDKQVPSFSIRLNIVRSSRGRWWLCEVHRVVGVVGEGRGVQRVHVGLLLPAAGLVLLVTLLHLLAWLLVMVLLVMLLLLLLLILHRGRHWHWQY